MRTVGLTRVNPPSYQDALLARLAGGVVADVEQWDIDSCQRFPKDMLSGINYWQLIDVVE